MSYYIKSNCLFHTPENQRVVVKLKLLVESDVRLCGPGVLHYTVHIIHVWTHCGFGSSQAFFGLGTKLTVLGKTHQTITHTHCTLVVYYTVCSCWRKVRWASGVVVALYYILLSMPEAAVALDTIQLTSARAPN